MDRSQLIEAARGGIPRRLRSWFDDDFGTVEIVGSFDQDAAGNGYVGMVVKVPRRGRLNVRLYPLPQGQLQVTGGWQGFDWKYYAEGTGDRPAAAARLRRMVNGQARRHRQG